VLVQNELYIVDSVALAEEELILLHRNAALTQGANRYRLTYRAALGTQMVATRHIPFVAFLRMRFDQRRSMPKTATSPEIALSIRL